MDPLPEIMPAWRGDGGHAPVRPADISACGDVKGPTSAKRGELMLCRWLLLATSRHATASHFFAAYALINPLPAEIRHSMSRQNRPE